MEKYTKEMIPIVSEERFVSLLREFVTETQNDPLYLKKKLEEIGKENPSVPAFHKAIEIAYDGASSGEKRKILGIGMIGLYLAMESQSEANSLDGIIGN